MHLVYSYHKKALFPKYIIDFIEEEDIENIIADHNILYPERPLFANDGVHQSTVDLFENESIRFRQLFSKKILKL